MAREENPAAALRKTSGDSFLSVKCTHTLTGSPSRTLDNLADNSPDDFVDPNPSGFDIRAKRDGILS
jgi:hypothetical protein